MPEKKSEKRKTSITEIGQTVPGNFKFGLIVAVALFWTDFIRSILNTLFPFADIDNTILTDLILAIAATALGYGVLIGYRKIRSRLEKIKI
ncbi:MAG: hypothetical protein JW762_12845 [Dehalococcoidales bacterium]|nr:hypothetical protein [Dehalococcoidales bacterium]